ncbi:ewing's tumor-associated antigen 1 [Nothobranchius furzeri]|uniref:ETAA1 activator of ATR kinase n=2 Tax=Nothobranchius furzeri TaxID=105023 RepID=A0A1A7ZND5_NOTFU|nr:Ewing tumor-associated antigen 1 [Nothobranchius furzeri]
MAEGRESFESPAGVGASPSTPQATKPARANRLSRSFRLTQAATEDMDRTRNQVPEFKTPTRIPRSKPAAGSCGESPQDSDVSHDIIWDATSPPCRFGKRGKKHPVGMVNISEIVSRIAPTHGRPQVAEPTLQQWIGDSAAIPCTPDLQAHRPKRKSPRSNGVDDLLRLAKQFDLNLFHRDEEENVDPLELRSEDVLDRSGCLPSLPGIGGPAVTGTSMLLEQDLLPDEDLDLFLVPTQQASGIWNRTPSQSRSISAAPTKDSGKMSGSTSAVDVTGTRPTVQDDWDDDDLLNDSLVVEMTQNPLAFIVPKFCSTQNPEPLVTQRQTAAPISAASSGSSVRVQMDPRMDWQVDLQLTGFSTQTGLHRIERSCPSDVVKPEPQQIGPKGSERSSSYAQIGSIKPDGTDLTEDDLETLFSLDPVWDDPADDDLLCEMCEDLENQLQKLDTKPIPVQSNQRAVLQQTYRTCENRIQTDVGGPLDRPVTTATGKGPELRSVKCSAAEIELKKQQAMKRRRQRLQAMQN